MFTGLIKGTGTVKTAAKGARGARLSISLGEEIARSIEAGDSVAVNGACLTVTEIKADAASFDVSSESLNRTTLGSLASGDRVNLEPALAAGDPLGGHIVQGHVDGVATLDAVTPDGDAKEYRFRTTREILDGIVVKGSVAVDGVSLTVTAVDAGTLSVVLVPYTLRKTTLADIKPGDAVNIETDIIGKWVRRLLDARAGGIDEGKLREHGFI